MPSNWRSPPRPGEKSPEQGRSYNRLNREIDRRREGGGWVQSRHVSTKFEKRVWRERNPLRRTQCGEAFRRFAQRRFEVSNTEACQTTLHPVHDARALTNEALTLTVRALRILLRQRWNRCHVTVIWFATQPTDEDAFERSSVEPIRFRTAMLARYGYARWMNDVGFDVTGP